MTNLTGSIYFWVGALFILLAAVEACLTLVCVVMMEIDHPVPFVDHNWNCGVAIHGFLFMFAAAIGIFCAAFTWLLLKADWWRIPLQQRAESKTTTATATVGVFMMLAGSAIPKPWWCDLIPRDVKLFEFGLPLVCGVVGSCLSLSATVSLLRRFWKLT